MANMTTEYPWKFQRIGGIDQVILANAQDIAHLDELDPKLWVALSCPASGLELDDKTLSLLDKDNDDRIRISDIVDAIKWLKIRLKNLDGIVECVDELPLSTIDTSTEIGQRLLTTAKAILANIEQANKETISIADLKQSNVINGNNLYNGDGIIPSTNKIDDDLQLFVRDALSVMGGVKDASGLDGINNSIALAFKQSLQDWLNWRESICSFTTPFGDEINEVWQLVQDVKDKVDDYFLRTELASYAPQSQQALNVDEKYIVPTDNGILENSALAELPLSAVNAAAPLSLDTGLNPIWRDKIVQLAQLIEPFVADKKTLTSDEWSKVKTLLLPYTKALASKPTLANVDVTIKSTNTIDKLGEARIKQILQSDLFARFEELANLDSTTPAAAADIADVERLISYHHSLYRLLMNFASFYDFFDLDTRTAAFQAGNLFIDGRCCTLSIFVTDIAKHAVLANYSELFLIYCECTKKTPPVNDQQEKKNIVAAMTSGDADLLIEGRNGVFIDNDGNDWDAKVVKIINKPISISQAVWEPYKRFGRFVNEQLNKWATARDSTATDILNKSATSPDPVKFDIAKSMGIFAAIGLALGALGTAIATIATSLFQLHWWQFPLVFVSIFLIISGPSVILAWLKLRQRTLGPLLEASGWAINGKVKINIYLGGKLTSKAELPKEATRSLIDPMKKNRNKPRIVFFTALIIGIIVVGGWLLANHYFNKTPETVTTTVTHDEIAK